MTFTDMISYDVTFDDENVAGVDASRRGVLYLVGVGSSLPDGVDAIARARAHIDAHHCLAVLGASAPVSTPPFGGAWAGRFINAALALRASLCPAGRCIRSGYSAPEHGPWPGCGITSFSDGWRRC